ncbi:MAG: hypothetical protein JXR29_09250 [Methylothermaceae bacterium]|nr:hypothetical protein [Methylothermaceae bacterium]
MTRDWQTLKRPFGHPLFQLAAIALAVAAAYGHTLDVPFYLDDYLSLQRNPAIRTLDGDNLWRYSPQRVVGYFTFALNYALHQLALPGYHLGNIVIHLLAAWLVWGLGRAILQTPALRQAGLPRAAHWLPLLAALIFALHPLQTQAVTYITQRLASLAALWYLAALLCYLQMRLATASGSRIAWLTGFVLAAAAAFFTKQNTVTLPLACLLAEIAFFPRSRRNPLVWGGLGLLLVGGLFTLWAMSHLDGAWWRRLDAMSRETHWFSRPDYLAAQMKALWWYIRLFFYPVGLRFDYAVHEPPTWGDPAVLIAAVAHALLIAAALWGLRRYPLAAFGVLFYYTAHLVESSVLPIRDLLFEHRTYLPNAGLALAVAGGLTLRLPARLPRGQAWGYGFACLGLAALAIATWQRNQLWRDPIDFWQSNVALSPEAYRPRLELANSYFDAGRSADARQVAEELVALLDRHGWRPGEKDLPDTVVANLALAYTMVQRYDDAERVARHYARRVRSRETRANLQLVLGDAAFVRKEYPRAETHYRKAVDLYPANPSAWLSLGETLGVQQRYADSRQVYQKLLQRWPDHPVARKKLALAEYLMNRQSRARPASR